MSKVLGSEWDLEIIRDAGQGPHSPPSGAAPARHTISTFIQSHNRLWEESYTNDWARMNEEPGERRFTSPRQNRHARRGRHSLTFSGNHMTPWYTDCLCKECVGFCLVPTVSWTCLVSHCIDVECEDLQALKPTGREDRLTKISHKDHQDNFY